MTEVLDGFIREGLDQYDPIGSQSTHLGLSLSSREKNDVWLHHSFLRLLSRIPNVVINEEKRWYREAGEWCFKSEWPRAYFLMARSDETGQVHESEDTFRGWALTGILHQVRHNKSSQGQDASTSPSVEAVSMTSKPATLPLCLDLSGVSVSGDGEKRSVKDKSISPLLTLSRWDLRENQSLVFYSLICVLLASSSLKSLVIMKADSPIAYLFPSNTYKSPSLEKKKVISQFEISPQLSDTVRQIWHNLSWLSYPNWNGSIGTLLAFLHYLHEAIMLTDL